MKIVKVGLVFVLLCASAYADDEWTTHTTGEGLEGKTVNDSTTYGDVVWYATNTGLLRFEGGSWDVFFEDFIITSVKADNSGVLWVGGQLSLLHSYTLSKYDGDEWVTWFLDSPVTSLSINENNVLRFSNNTGDYTIDGINVKKDTDVDNTHKTAHQSVSNDDKDYFPLEIGNTWVYKRKFNIAKFRDVGPEYEDKTILTIIDTVAVNDTMFYKFLDGSLFRKDELGNVYEPVRLLYDIRPCGEVDCYEETYYIEFLYRRKTVSVEVPLGIFQGYTFYVGVIHGYSKTIAPPVGMVKWRLTTDVPENEALELEYACVNGHEYVMTHVEQSEAEPVPFMLYPPYPNPFNTSTTIEFTLTSQGFANLTIYNISGQKIRTLVNKTMSAGIHTVNWDGTNEDGLQVSSGVYLSRLLSGPNEVTKPMILLK